MNDRPGAAPRPRMTMLTFAPMIDSETTRFLLWHYGIAHREERHIFGWASLLTLAHGGYGQIPIVYGRGVHLTGPRAIVGHFDPRCAPATRLLPPTQPMRTQIEADWTRYNGELAAWTAALAYFHLLPDRAIMTEAFSRGLPAWEAGLTRRFYPALRGLFTLLLQLSAGNARDCLSRIRVTFERTDARLADGRPFLAGDRLTLSDIALAAAAAPLLLPPAYAALLPPLAALPAEMQAIVAEMRQHPTAVFVERIYARRQASGATPAQAWCDGP